MKYNNVVKLLTGQWDRAAAVALVLAGLVAVVIGWVAVSDTILTFEQIPYLMSGGLVGVCLVVLGSTLWVSADLRDEWRKLDRLEETLRDAQPLAAAPTAAPRELRVSAES